MLILDACTNISVLGTVLFIKKLVQIISIIVPILLVLLITIDFAKAVMANSDDDMKRAQRLAIKRIIIASVVFFVPLIVDTAFTTLSDKGVSGLSCYDNASDEVLSPLIEADKANLELKEAERKKLIEAAKVSNQAAKDYIKTLQENRQNSSTNKSGSSESGSSATNVSSSYIQSNCKMAEATKTHTNKKVWQPWGDQDGKEVLITKNDNDWAFIARFKDPKKSNLAAQCMENAAANNHIGYDNQGSHTYMGQKIPDYKQCWVAASKVKWDVSKITKNCSTACCPLVAICLKAAGLKNVSPGLQCSDANSVKKALEKTGAFEFYSSKKYTRSCNHLMRGDVLVRSGSIHAAMAT